MMASKKRSRYGRAILGEKEFQRQKQIQKETRGIYGPAITDRDKPKTPDAPKVESPEGTKEDAELTLPELEKLLKANPELLERQIRAEWLRPDGPRKGAIRLFIEFEQNREEGSRPELVASLEAALSAR